MIFYSNELFDVFVLSSCCLHLPRARAPMPMCFCSWCAPTDAMYMLTAWWFHQRNVGIFAVWLVVENGEGASGLVCQCSSECFPLLHNLLNTVILDNWKTKTNKTDTSLRKICTNMNSRCQISMWFGTFE